MEAHLDQPEAPRSETGSKSIGKDDLQTLPLAEIEKTLGSSPDGLTQAEAQKRLTQYGPNEIAEKKTNEILKFLSYFWGPIPWMIEVAVILSAAARHWPDFGIICFCFSPTPLSDLGGASGGQRHRRPEGHARDQGEGETRRQVDQSGGARPCAWRRHPPAPRRHRAGRCALAGRRRDIRGPVGADRGSLPASRKSGDAVFSGSIVRRGEIGALVYATGGKTYFGKTAELVETAVTTSHFQKAVLKIGDYLIVLALILVAVIVALGITVASRSSPCCNSHSS